MIEFTIYGEPVAQGRPRFTTINGHPRAYDPKKSRDFKSKVAEVAKDYALPNLLDGPLSLRIKVYKPSLKGFSKRKRAAAERGELRPVTKPDVDNYVKGIKDALSKVIWKDDNQVVDLQASKFYSERPRVEIKVIPLSEQVEQLNLI